MSYDNNMRGTIAKNDRKEKDTHPDIRGQCEIDGVAYWIDGWQKQRASDGSKFYSLTFKRKEAPGIKPPPTAKQLPTPSPEDDDVPF